MVNDVSTQTEPHEPAAAAQPLVRVIDDDDTVRRSWQFVLEGEGWSVIELQAELKKRGNAMPLVLISAHADLVMAVKAVREGAFDFLLKPVETEHLIERVSEAIETDAQRRIERAEIDGALHNWALLSAREKDVARGVAEGKLNKQIAFDLNISEKTVIAHRSALCRKLGIRTGADITRMLLVVEREEKAQGKKA